MADKYHSDTQEKIESVSYQPSLPDSGDLETGTKTVTATAEATGVGNADYSVGLTLPKPSDVRLTVIRIAARLAVTIDSMTAGQLNCRVYVDSQDAQNRLFDTSWVNAGAKLIAVDTHTGNLATIFSLLKDGAAHTFYFFFWVNAGNAVISLCQLWEGVGSCDTGFWGVELLKLEFTGTIRIASNVARIGTGAINHHIWGDGGNADRIAVSLPNNDMVQNYLHVGGTHWSIGGSVATDLNYIAVVYIYLRSER